MREARKLHLHVEVKQGKKNFDFLLHVANREVISAEPEVAHSRRRWSDLVVRSVLIKMCFKNSVTVCVCSLNVFFIFRILSQIKAA